MSSNYYQKGRDFTEELANHIFKKAGVKSVLNNRQNKSAVDILVNDVIKIDVQFSNKYATYGDFRLDFISAFHYVNEPIAPVSSNIFGEFERIHNAKIYKKGKYFEEPDYLDFVIIFFYNHTLLADRLPRLPDFNAIDVGFLPDYTLIINSDALIKYVNENSSRLLHNVKINNKRGHNIYERHESAFLPVSTRDIFNNINRENYLWTNGLPSSDELVYFFNKLPF